MEREKEYKKGRSIALDFLSRKPRTVFEVKKRMADKEVSSELFEEIVSQLQDEKLLDDREYVAEWLSLVAERRGYGRLLIFKKLKNLGIDPNIIDEVFREEYAFKEKEIASREAKKKIVTFREGLSSQDIKNKLIRFLASRGFQEEIIFEILEVITE